MFLKTYPVIDHSNRSDALSYATPKPPRSSEVVACILAAGSCNQHTMPKFDTSQSSFLRAVFLHGGIIHLYRAKRSRATSSEGLPSRIVELSRHQVPEPRALPVNLSRNPAVSSHPYIQCRHTLTNSRNVPLSTICPSSSTTIRSARAIVDSRCATTRHVVCLDRKILSIASLTRCSEVASSELVASSSARIAGFFSSARAIASLCRWPPESDARPTARTKC